MARRSMVFKALENIAIQVADVSTLRYTRMKMGPARVIAARSTRRGHRRFRISKLAGRLRAAERSMLDRQSRQGLGSTRHMITMLDFSRVCDVDRNRSRPMEEKQRHMMGSFALLMLSGVRAQRLIWTMKDAGMSHGVWAKVSSSGQAIAKIAQDRRFSDIARPEGDDAVDILIWVSRIMHRVGAERPDAIAGKYRVYGL